MATIYPIVELIAQNLVATLKGIRDTAGYSCSLTVERFKRTGNAPPEHFKAVVCMGQRPRQPGQPFQFVDRSQEWIIDVCVMVSETSELAVDTVINQVDADIGRALMRDAHRGGYAMDTVIGDPVLWTSANGEYSGIEIHLTTPYRTDELNPYSAAPGS